VILNVYQGESGDGFGLLTVTKRGPGPIVGPTWEEGEGAAFNVRCGPDYKRKGLKAGSGTIVNANGVNLQISVWL
jgi:hypothetical protein